MYFSWVLILFPTISFKRNYNVCLITSWPLAKSKCIICSFVILTNCLRKIHSPLHKKIKLILKIFKILVFLDILVTWKLFSICIGDSMWAVPSKKDTSDLFFDHGRSHEHWWSLSFAFQFLSGLWFLHHQPACSASTHFPVFPVTPNGQCLDLSSLVWPQPTGISHLGTCILSKLILYY